MKSPASGDVFATQANCSDTGNVTAMRLGLKWTWCYWPFLESSLVSTWAEVEARTIYNVLQAERALYTSAQLPEVEIPLLAHLAEFVPERSAVDIGSFEGAYIDTFRKCQLKTMAFEPVPSKAGALAHRWRNDPMVEVENLAVSDENGCAEIFLGDWLHGSDRDLNPGDVFNTLEAREANEFLRFPRSLTITRRRYRSLVDAHLAPANVGIMKIDTEGHDVAVLRGAWPYVGRLTLCEYWSRDFLFNAGKTHNDVADYRSFFSAHGKMHALVIGRDAANPCLFYQVNPNASSRNSWGNILFTADEMLFGKAVAWCERALGAHRVRA